MILGFFGEVCIRYCAVRYIQRSSPRQSKEGDRVSTLQPQILLPDLTLYNINILFQSMISINFFKIANNILQLNRAGAAQMIKQKVIHGRGKSQWKASEIKKESTLREQQQKIIAKFCHDIGIPDNEEVSDHHIFPGNRITKMLNGAIQTDEGLELVNGYLNSRKGITDWIVPQVQRGDQKQALASVYNSIFWYQYNLILGPKKRANDPKDGFDNELYEHQPQQTKEIYEFLKKQANKDKHNQLLRAFFSLRNINSVVWEQNKQKLYQAKAPISNYPGSTGFVYDQYPH